MTSKVLGERPYDVYCQAVDYKAFNGDKLKPFSELPEKIRKAWEAVDVMGRVDILHRMDDQKS